MKIHDSSRYIAFMETPCLWEGTLFGLTQFEFPKIDLSNFNASPLPDNIRLGHQIEQVFLQLLQHSKKHEVLLHNLPVRNDEKTLGEIDFIVRELSSGQMTHIELTYKFYLLDTSIKDPILRWIGPNRKDGLVNKLEKIKNEQFKLLHSLEGTRVLLDNDIDVDIINHKTCFKAQLFIPYAIENLEISPLNPACVMGYWLRFDDFKKETFQHYQYFLPSKLEWLDQPHNNVDWMDHSEVTPLVKNSLDREYSPMMWLKKSETEFEKVFVVWWVAGG